MSDQQDKALLDAYHLMDSDERDFWLDVFQTHTKDRKQKKAELRVIYRQPPATCEKPV